MNWSDKRVLVTGGASFIGSHLVDALVEAGALVRVIDNLSSGKLENIKRHIDDGNVSFWRTGVENNGLEEALYGYSDVVFHLANLHGGRGYVDSHQVDCARNMWIDNKLFDACRRVEVGKIVFASSACVYPLSLMNDPDELLYLTEEQVGPPYDADNMYGWAKLMAEMTLKAYYKEYRIKTVSCRYFHVYGERAVENHALIAMMGRAFTKEDPFKVWGTGEQVRNWTHVDDIVRGTLLAAQYIDDGTAVNIGTEDRIRVIDAVQAILSYTGHSPVIQFQPDMPTGPYNRVGSNELAYKLMGFEAKVPFEDGLKRTIDWYFATRNKADVEAQLAGRLSER